jgi:outer membrane receptor protein involved in Fe transport
MGATVVLFDGENVAGGAYTDLEGAYTIKAQAGEYMLVINYLSFISDSLKNISIKGGETQFFESILMPEMAANEDLAVIITARRDQASTTTLFNKKRTSVNSIDGISVDLIKRTGDPNVAAAMQRITGVTVEGGKYIYVRGLGDRYSMTTLNGAEIPGLDPNRNSVQMDIFPSALIDNIVVYKNFTPDLPGSFSGGLVNVVTKDFPDKLYMEFSATTGYNTQASLKDDFISYETGKLDFLGMDDGTRDIPRFIQDLPNGVPPISFTDKEKAYQLDEASKSFETGMTPFDKNSFLNQNYQFSLGNQYELGGRPIGFIASLSYRNTYSLYNDGRLTRWENNGTSDNPASSLLLERDLSERLGTREALWGALAKISYKPSAKSKVGLTFMHNQSGESKARSLQGPLPSDAPDLIYQTREVSYEERKLDAVQLSGEHAGGKLKVNWIGSGAFSSVNTPDLRLFNNDFVVRPGNDTIYNIQPNLYPAPFRIWRNLSEIHGNAKADFELPFNQWSGRESKFKFGLSGLAKSRDFSETRFQYSVERPLSQGYAGDPVSYFSDDNLGIQNVDTFPGYLVYDFGNHITDASEDRNIYTGQQYIWAAYLMTEIPLVDRLRLVGGIRYEGTEMQTNSNEGGYYQFDPEVGGLTFVSGPAKMQLHDVLPAAHLIFSVNEFMNFRTGYSRTLARPTFREFASFSSLTTDGSGLVTGNPGLERTLIDNFDFRWEWFPSPSEVISVSAFYKQFHNPIEVVQVPEAPNLEFTWRNVPKAETYGVEFELRKTLGFISPKLENLQFGGNLAIIRSQVDQDPSLLNLIQSVDPFRETRRPLQGQSPFAANAEIAYVNDSIGMQLSLSYNVFGDRIAVVGAAEPDVYEQSRGLLNFSISQKLGEHFSLRLRANNLLDPAFKMTQTYRDTEFIFSNYKAGRTFSLGLTYNW